MGIGGKRPGGAKIGGRRRANKLWVEGTHVRRTVRGEIAIVPAPPGSGLPAMLKLLPRSRGLFAPKED